MSDKVENKIVPIRPDVVRELDNYVAKSWDTANNMDAASELWSEELQAFLDATTLKSLFFSEDWVYIIVDLIANKISSQPLVVMTSTVENGVESQEPDPENPINALLEQPNAWQDYAQWMYNTAVELFLMGNAVVWNAPNSGQLITLPTENVTLDFDQAGKVQNYVLSNFREDSTGFRELQSTMQFAEKEIVHIRRTNPSSLLWGLSPFTPGRKSVLFNRYSSDYLNSFYVKQATPGLALTLDRNVNEDTALRQLRSFELAYQGRKNARRTLILPKGVDAKPLTHSLSDQKLIEHIEKNRETICGLLKVPKHELGLQQAGSLGSEEHRLALRNFWESTLIPGMRLIEGMLTKHFQNELGEDSFLQFDLSNVEALKDDMAKKATIAKEMLQAGLSINEVRTQVWKEDPSEAPGSDEPYVLTSRVSLQPQTPANFSQGGDESEDDSGKSLRRKLKISDRVGEIRTIRAKQLDQEEARTITALSQAAIDLLINMTERALDVIEKSDKALAKKDLPTQTILRRRIQNALGEFDESWENEIARTLTASVELGYDQQLELVFNTEARQEIEALRARDEDGRRASLSERGLESFDQISRTHTDRIIGQIAEGQEKGESITDIMRRVANSLGTPGQLAGRAETIARTETLTAVSIGQAAATENASEVIPGLQKTWLTAGDDRVRDSHRDLDGDTIAVDEVFDNGLRHPRDVKGRDPAETINCRCTLLLLPPDAEDLAFEIPQGV